MCNEKNAYTLILASASPRRKEFLEHLNIPFEIKTMSIKEETDCTLPDEIVLDLAKKKGIAVFNELQRLKDQKEKNSNFADSFFPLIVAADTLVFLGKEQLGRPRDALDAKEMLKKLSGKQHFVYTGVYIVCFDIEKNMQRERSFYCKTEVDFAHITEDFLEEYIKSGESMDKAGAYGIQGSALSFISGIKGSYSNVVGFPLYEFVVQLKDFLGCRDDNEGEWRKKFKRTK
ncbi:MAG: septum formation protein Maf [Oligoflexia bacterium]|nr:septum formation protein Maf [Oligoflexia bacterium]